MRTFIIVFLALFVITAFAQIEEEKNVETGAKEENNEVYDELAMYTKKILKSSPQIKKEFIKVAGEMLDDKNSTLRAYLSTCNLDDAGIKMLRARLHTKLGKAKTNDDKVKVILKIMNNRISRCEDYIVKNNKKKYQNVKKNSKDPYTIMGKMLFKDLYDDYMKTHAATQAFVNRYWKIRKSIEKRFPPKRLNDFKAGIKYLVEFGEDIVSAQSTKMFNVFKKDNPEFDTQLTKISSDWSTIKDKALEWWFGN